jgi:hypothetical protein
VQDSNGYVELLRDDAEDDYAFGYGSLRGLLDSGDPRHTFLMAGYDDLNSWYGVDFGYRVETDRVTFYWETETYCDAGSGILNRFQIVLYSDSRVQWNFDYANYACNSNDLFSGLYIGHNDNDLVEVYWMFLPENESWLYQRRDANANNILEECEIDSDGDGIWNFEDDCPDDADNDIDGDGICGDVDNCPNDANKSEPGVCGCGAAETDTDGDGTPDCADGCPNDANKTSAGTCGCGVADDDSDGDGIVDCLDNCANTPNPDQADADGNGVGDACDAPPAPQPAGDCGCGAGSALLVPLMLTAMGWMRRRKPVRRNHC